MAYSVWQKFITDGGEQVVASAVITVFFESSGAPATIYDGPAGASLGNSTVSDITGLARFFAPAGVYKIVASKGAFFTEFRHVQLGDASSRDVGTADNAYLLTVGDATDRHPLRTEVGVAGGLATLDGAGKVPSSQLPSYVLMFADFASFPVTGEAGVIYVAEDSGSAYRWTGAAYLKIADDDVLQYANLAAFPVSGAAGTLYIAADTGLVYRWDGSAYVATGLQPIANNTVLGNVSGGTATPVALTKTQVREFVGQKVQVAASPVAGSTVTLNADVGTLHITGPYLTSLTLNCTNLADGAAVSVYCQNGIGTVTYTGGGLNYEAGGAPSWVANATKTLARNGTRVGIGTALSPDMLELFSGSGVNGIVPVRGWQVRTNAANCDFVVSPKGSGAILAQLPDGTTAGGNKRGQYAVDLQTFRTVATQVASGNYSVVGGGYGNIASGSSSCVPGGSLNLAGTGSNFAAGISSDATSPASASVAIGDNCTASNQGAVALGKDAIASGIGSVALGQGTTATGVRSFAAGKTATASAEGAAAIGQSVMASGQNATAFNKSTTASGVCSTAFGENSTSQSPHSIASGKFAKSTVACAHAISSGGFTAAPSQVQRFHVYGTLTAASTNYALTTAGATTIPTVAESYYAANSSYAAGVLSGHVAFRLIGGSDVKIVKFEVPFVITGGTITMPSPVFTTVYETAGASGWVLDAFVLSTPSAGITLRANVDVAQVACSGYVDVLELNVAS